MNKFISKMLSQGIFIASMVLVPTWVFAGATTPEGSSGSSDYTRKDLAGALINYWAAAQVLEYQKDEQLLFMVAPGSNWALAAGAVAGASDTATLALKYSDSTIGNTLSGVVTNTVSEFKINDTTIKVDNPRVQKGPLQFYDTMAKLFTAGETANIAMVNPGAVLLKDNVANMDPALAQQMINLITNPFPYIDPSIQSKLDSNPEQEDGKPLLNGADKEYLGGKLADIALMGISASAWGDIISRRVPANGQTQSVMELMDKYSAQRFTSPDWIKQMGAASETALLREIAQMQSFSIWMQYHQYRIEEQQLAATSALLALMAKMNSFLDQANQQMISSKAQAKAANQQLKNMKTNKQ